MLLLGPQEAELPMAAAAQIIERICDVAATFATTVRHGFAGQVTQGTLDTIVQRIDDNLRRLR